MNEIIYSCLAFAAGILLGASWHWNYGKSLRFPGGPAYGQRAFERTKPVPTVKTDTEAFRQPIRLHNDDGTIK